MISRAAKPLFFIVALNAILIVTAITALANPSTTMRGYFSYITIDGGFDPNSTTASASETLYFISTKDGETVPLTFDAHRTGDLTPFYRREVEVSIAPNAKRDGMQYVTGIRALNAFDSTQAFGSPLSGKIHVVNLLCKPKDISSEPRPASKIATMFRDQYPSVPHYWESVSYGQIDIKATTLGWKKMKRKASYYLNLSRHDRLDTLLKDCAAAHDSAFNFAKQDYVINLYFNTDFFDGSAVGGGTRVINLDGRQQTWRATWLPDGRWYHAVTVHEMGHSFGLPHSNSDDGDNDPYDNQFDVMSVSFVGYYNGNIQDPDMAWLGSPTNTYHLAQLGWVTPEKQFVLMDGEATTITLDNWMASGSTNYRSAVIPLDDGRAYVVETRNNQFPYQDMMHEPANGVIVYEVNPNRREPVWLVGGTSDNAHYQAFALQPDDEFTHVADGVTVAVGAQTTNGYEVTLTRTSDNEGMELVKNGNFEYGWVGNAGLPPVRFWTATEKASKKPKCKGYYLPGDGFGRNNTPCAYRFVGKKGVKPTIKQTLNTTLPDFAPGDTLKFSLYTQTSFATPKLKSTAVIFFSDSSKQMIQLANPAPSESYTQLTSGAVAIEGLESKTVEKVVITLMYQKATGNITVDDVSLMYVPAESEAVLVETSGGGQEISLPLRQSN